MNVLVCLDDSSHSQYMVDAIVRRKWPQDTRFEILRVIEPPDDDEFEDEALVSLADEVHKRRRTRAEALCQEARKKIEEHVAHSQVFFEVRDGDACCQIINVAVDRGSDRILMGAHSRAACPHSLLGSVSRAVSAHAPCSVEVIREKPTLVKSGK